MSNDRYSLARTHCIVFYDHRKLKLTTEEFLKIAKVVENPQSKTITIRGAIYAIGDMKFVGSLEDAPRYVDPSYVPPGQNVLEDAHEQLGYGKMFLTGDVSDLPMKSKEFKMKAKRQWFEHVKRRPQLQKENNLDYGKFSPEELRIINTPIETLMSDFEKTL